MMNGYTKSVIRKILIIFGVAFILAWWVVRSEAGPSCVHIVQKGDTLAKISKQHLGSCNWWPKLAELNGLENPHLIHPGQKILLAEPLTDQEREHITSRVIWDKMIKTFKVVHGRTFDNPDDSRAWAFEPLNIVDRQMPTPQIRGLLREVATRLEWTDLTSIHRAIMAETKNPEEALLLASLVDHESNYRNAEGIHGEIGPCQVMPSTGLSVLKNSSGISIKVHAEGPVDMLWNVRVNVWVAWTHFNNLLKRVKGNVFKALQRYNGHGEPTIIYARSVMSGYEKYKDTYAGKLQETMLAEIKNKTKNE